MKRQIVASSTKRSYVKAASTAKMLNAFEGKLEELQEGEGIESSTKVTSSIHLTDEQRDLLWEVIDQYNTSHPVSGKWEDETAHEQRTIADTFGISLADAKQIMIDELGFDPNLEGHMEEDHWAEDDIESSTDTQVNASDTLQLFDDDGYHNYEDTDGMYTGVPGSFVTLAELKNYWNDFYDDDPVLNEEYDRDQGQKWLNDTLRYMKEVESCDSVNAANALHTGRDENTWYIDTNGHFTGHPGEKVSRADLIDYWNENLGDDPSLEGDLEGWLDHTVEFMEPVYSNTEEVDEELDPVKGEQQWGDDQVFVLIDYAPGGPEAGMDADSFDPIGKFFAVDLADAKKQLEKVKQTESDRMQFLSNPYVDEYNEFIDDGSEVYPNLETLIKNSWIAPNDYEGNVYDDDLTFASTQAEGDAVEAALIVDGEEVADTIEDVECIPVNDPINAALIIDGEEVADTIEDIECATNVEDKLWDIDNRIDEMFQGADDSQIPEAVAKEKEMIMEELGVDEQTAIRYMKDVLDFDDTYLPVESCGDVPVEGGLFSDYFGKEQAEKYGDLICQNLSGKTVSKRRDLAEEPGGLVYEANLLGIDMWDLLEALEGLCYQGKAMEIDDSTYKVK